MTAYSYGSDVLIENEDFLPGGFKLNRREINGFDCSLLPMLETVEYFHKLALALNRMSSKIVFFNFRRIYTIIKNELKRRFT